MKAENREATLSGFLEEIALIADIDSVDENQDYVVLMTLHSAKGLEFPYVYLAGMEDGMFPSSMCIFSAGEIPELEIVAAEKEDIDKLMNFMING